MRGEVGTKPASKQASYGNTVSKFAPSRLSGKLFLAWFVDKASVGGRKEGWLISQLDGT